MSSDLRNLIRTAEEMGVGHGWTFCVRVTGTALVIAVALVTPVLATATSTPASADTVVNGCTIVSNPTPTNFTNCPGANLAGTSLSGDDLSYANLSSATLDDADLSNVNLSSANLTGAALIGCAQTPTEEACIPATLTGANLTDANLTDATLATCATGTLGQTGCGAVDLSGIDLSSVNFTGATLGACLNGCASVDFTGTLLVPSDQTVTAAKKATSAVLTWPTPQSLPGATPGSCTPSSGSAFPVGTTTVACQVLDDQGNVATGTFTVTVLAAHGHGKR